MRALISIHDVMPETLDRVGALLARIPEPARHGLVLLVVPGRNWQAQQIARLAQWQRQGLELAGHGWHHRSETIDSFYHRWHARFISRNAAEHLSLPRTALCQLLADCWHWFEQHRLSPPKLYVPPAWALGALRRDDLAASPFRYFETTTGLYDSRYRVRRRLPLVGYEADTLARQWGLRCWNLVNRQLATSARPLRLALHPFDAELCLAGDLEHDLSQLTGGVSVRDIFRGCAHRNDTVTTRF